MTHALTLSPETLAYLSQTRNFPLVAIVAVKFAVCVSKWATRRRTRQTLRQLEDWQLEDVGLTPRQAHDECAKAFWKA